jgi:hypothetical protein
MDPLGDMLTTRPIRTGWEFTIDLYLSPRFGFIDYLVRTFGNGSVWTRSGTRSDGPEPLPTLTASDIVQTRSKYCTKAPDSKYPLELDTYNDVRETYMVDVTE